MLARLKTFTLLGIEAMAVDVEVDISPAAMPKTILVGLPDTAVKESTHRVERAIVNSGFIRPQDRVVINLAPGDLPKQAPSFDLPVALGVLAGSGQLDAERLEDYAVVGELALEGITRPIKGVLSIAIEAAKDKSLKGLIVPSENAPEAAVVEDIEVIAVDSLAQCVAFLGGEVEIPAVPSRIDELFERFSEYDVDFSDVRGQEMAKRAMTLAAAGRHNLLMIGPPGSGKTMIAKRIPTILPQHVPAESIETTRIYSAVGQLPSKQPLIAKRPFRVRVTYHFAVQ
ncbi:MAG: magnesium chelatase domain-containing protein [Rhodopirellula sp. JB053]